jgi:hypothetical protein
VEYSGVANKPTLVSGSSQITYSGLTGIPSEIISGSSQVTFLGLSSIPSGIVSGSGQVDQFGYATTGSNGFNGSQSITGSLTVTGQVIAQTLNVQQVTSSIVYSSGSNIFGNNSGNTHSFTGSLGVTGGLNVGGASSFSSNVTATGNLNLQGAVTRNINFYDSSNTNINAQIQYDQISSTSGQLFFGTNNAGTFATRLTISNTGVSTFSNIVNVGYDSNNRSTIRLTSNAANRQAAIYFYGNNAESAILGYEGGSEIVSGGVQGDFVIRNALANKHIILATNNGNVGIGTLTPTGKLSVEATGNHITLRAPGATAGKYWALDITTANQFYLMNNAGTQYLTMTDGGNVGIGIATPNLSAGAAGSTILTVSATTSGRNGVIELNGTRTNSTDISGYVRFFNNGAATPLADIRAIRGSSDTSGDLVFTTSDTEQMRITSGRDIQLNSVGSLYSTTSVMSIPNSATTIFSSTGFGGVWLVTYAVSGNPAQVGYAIVGNAFGSTLTVLASTAGSQTSLSVSGLNLQLSQSAGGSINTRINVIKLNNTLG